MNDHRGPAGPEPSISLQFLDRLAACMSRPVTRDPTRAADSASRTFRSLQINCGISPTNEFVLFTALLTPLRYTLQRLLCGT